MPATVTVPSSPAPAAAPARPVALSDEQIARIIYSDGERTPDGFYAEEIPPTTAYVSTVHLKNTDIAASDTSPLASAYELCTDDWNEALVWSETAAARLPAYGDLVETNANPRFFEFVRVPRSNPQALDRQRVFRCAYLDRSSVDLRTLDGAGGVMQWRPLGADHLQELAEYLWQFTLFNNFGNAVLESRLSGSATTLAHDLAIATLTPADQPEACDRIDVVRWTHAVDASTGQLTRTFQALLSFEARERAGDVSICTAST